jgi:hypothetical protein
LAQAGGPDASQAAAALDAVRAIIAAGPDMSKVSLAG